MNLERFEPALQLLDDDRFYRSRRTRIVWGAVGIFLLAACVFARSVLANGLFWQDQPTLNSLTSLFSLAHIWTQAPGGIYRPISLALLWLEGRVAGRQAVPYHCISVVIHAASSVLLWFVLRRLAVPGAWLAAALFAIHPLQVQSVAWIIQQPHLLGGLAFLLAVWLYLRWAQIRPPLPEALAGMEPEDPPSAFRYAMALLAAAAAMLSDPLGICLPLVLLLLVWWKRGSLKRAQWGRLVPLFGIALIVLAVGILLPHPASEPLLAAPTLSALQRILIAGRAVETYAMGALRLYSTQFIHPLWDPAPGAWNVSPILIIAAIAIVAWAGRSRWGAAPIVCLLLFVVLLLPGLVTVFSQPAPALYVSDYHQYMAAAVPLTLIAVALAALATRLSSSMSLRSARALVGIVAIVLIGTFAVIQSLTYYDADTAFEAALRHNPANSIARAQYALWLLEEDPTKASGILDSGGPAAATDLSLLDARARVCLALNNRDEAISNYLLAQRLAPDNGGIRLGLAEACDTAGVQAMAEGRRDDASENYTDALAAYEAARQLNSSEEVVRDGIGKVLLHQGRLPESMDQFDAAIALNPGSVPARVHKAQALFAAGMLGEGDKVNEAITELRDALRIDPANSEAFGALADMQFRLKNFVSAERDYRAALQFHPGSAQMWTQLGFAQSAQDRYQEALRSFERALALQSDAPDAIRGQGLAKAQLAMGNQKS